jgi:hypothetical protein
VVDAVMQKHMALDTGLDGISQVLPGFAPVADQIKSQIRQGIAQALNSQAAGEQSPQQQMGGFLGSLTGAGG